MASKQAQLVLRCLADLDSSVLVDEVPEQIARRRAALAAFPGEVEGHEVDVLGIE
jgi:hypothetical protein